MTMIQTKDLKIINSRSGSYKLAWFPYISLAIHVPLLIYTYLSSFSSIPCLSNHGHIIKI